MSRAAPQDLPPRSRQPSPVLRLPQLLRLPLLRPPRLLLPQLLLPQLLLSLLLLLPLFLRSRLPPRPGRAYHGLPPVPLPTPRRRQPPRRPPLWRRRHARVAPIPVAPRPAPEPLAPVTTPSRRARACLEVAARAASPAKGASPPARPATPRRLLVRATTPLLPARECLARRVVARLPPVPGGPVQALRVRTRA